MKHSSKLVVRVLFTLALSSSACLWAQTFVYGNDNVTGTNTVSGFSVDSNGALTLMSGFPLPTGGTGTGGGLFAGTRILASPAQPGQQSGFLYVANGGSGNVSVFSIDPGTGGLTAVTGSPFATATPPGSPQDLLLAVTPDNKFLYAAEVVQREITVFSIASDGALTVVTGSTVSLPVSVNPAGMKVAPDGKFLAVAETDLAGNPPVEQIAMYSIASGGTLTAVGGSPFSTSPDVAANVDFNCGATTLFAFEEKSAKSQVGVFDIASDGSLSQISGSPFMFSSGEGSDGGILSPNGQTLFVSNQLSGTVTALTVASSGALSLVSGSPFAANVGFCKVSSGSGTGSCPAGMAMNSAGTLLFVSSISPETAAFSAAAGGVLTAVPGSPFSSGATGSAANSLAVSPPQTCGATANLNPASVAFGDQLLGTTSTTQTVTLYNPNPVYALTINSITLTGTNATDFSLLSSGSCPYTGGTVTPGSSCTVDLAFKPSAEGSRSAAVSVADNAMGSPQSISLTGTGAEPVVSLSPASLPAFASQAVGTTSAAQIITLTNTGAAPLSITSVSISGANSADFAQTNSCGSSVAAAGSCAFNVTFTPQAINARTATLTITDNNGAVASSAQTFALTGIGSGATANLSGTSLTFSGQNVGATSPGSTVTVTNNGNAPLAISSIAISGSNAADFAQTNNCGSSVAAGKNCTVNVTFKPTSSGTRTATLTISDDAVGSASQTVSLTGTGLGATANLSATALSFTGQNVGSASPALPVTVTNNGSASLAISDITITGANGGDFSETNSCGGSVAAGRSCTVQVTFKPTSSNPTARNATLTISDNAVGSGSQTVSLTGTAKDFSLAVSAAAPVSAGQSATYTLTLTPVGGFSDTLQVTCAEPSGLTLSACTASPASVTLNGSAAATATITVSTTATQSRIPPRLRFWSHWNGPWRIHPGLLLGWWLAIVVGMLAFLGLRQQAPAQRRRFARLAAGWGTIALVATLWAACGGGGVSSQSPPPPAPAVSLSHSSLTFASQSVSTTSAAQPVTLSNTGNASLSISGIAATGDFAQSSTCGTSLAAGANCQISITFKPTTNGQRTGSLSVTDNATGSPQSVSLTGTGVKPGTPAGNYSVTLTVSGGGVTHTSTATLTVH